MRRLLESIAHQTFNNFEIVITDDSPDDSVKNLLSEFPGLAILYQKNSPSLGSPANWNKGISLAKGDWIKLIHDDDWFSRPDSLELFANATKQGNKFIFSAYANCFEFPGGEIGNGQDFKKIEPVWMNASWGKKILQQPMTLLAYNVIGPPSVTLVHRSIAETFDERLKWRVDMEYYVRLLNKQTEFYFIKDVLVNVGVSESQVTQSCIYQPQVELPEGWLLLQKHGNSPLRNIWVYDAWWRLLRNMNIRTDAALNQYVADAWPLVIRKMVSDLAKIPAPLLKSGVLSKSFMFASYLKNQSSINILKKQ